MPNYEYFCPGCNRTFECFKNVSERDKVVWFKGPGWTPKGR